MPEIKKRLRLDLSGFKYKKSSIARAPKILIRQAGVGLTATLEEHDARFPQSVYAYHLKPEWEAKGYRHEFVLGALLSRTLIYHVFKRFGEIDPARAHAKLTHERLKDLPIPTIDFGDREQKRRHDEIVDDVRKLLDGQASLGGPEDTRTELNLRTLWGLTADDGAYINSELSEAPDSQVLTDLFPNGRPPRMRRHEIHDAEPIAA